MRPWIRDSGIREKTSRARLALDIFTDRHLSNYNTPQSSIT
ncbi:MAG: hypothetical protein ACTMUP_03670 [cyanobacterium endosymbiont of Rhopalodia musculus]